MSDNTPAFERDAPAIGPGPNGRAGTTASHRALIAAAIAIPLLFTAAGAWLAWRSAWNEARQETARAADASAEFVRRTFDGLLLRIDRANGILNGLTDEQIRAEEADLHERIRRAATARARWSGPREPYLFVFDRDANPLVAGNLFPVGPLGNFADREFNQTLRGPHATDLAVSPVYVGRGTGEAFFALTVRRERTGNNLPPGSYDGVINASVYVVEWEAALARLASADDVLSVARLDGLLLARTVPMPPGTRIMAASALLLAVQAGGVQGVLAVTSTLDGERRIASYRRVEGYPVFTTAARRHAVVWRQWAVSVLPMLAGGVSATLALLWLATLVGRQQRALTVANDALEGRVSRRTAALLASEKRLQETLDTLDLATFIGRDMAGNIRYWSEGASRLYGWTADEALGRDAHTLLRTDCDMPSADIQSALLRDHAWQGDLRRVTRDGRHIIVNSQKVLRMAPDGSPRMVLAVDTDVTAHRATEAALADSATRLRLAQEAGEVGIWDWDVAGGSVIWSETCHRIHGTSPGRPLTIDLWESLVHPAERAGMKIWADAMLEGTERSWAPAMRIRRPSDDAERWVACRGEVLRDAAGRPARMLGVALDITEQREAGAALRASEARARLAVDGAGLGTWEYDFARSRFSWTARLSEIDGDAPEPREDVPLAEWLARLHPDDVALAEIALRDAAHSAADITLELRIRTAQRDWRWVAVYGAVDDAEIARGVVQDVTDRRMADERQRLLMREVDHRAKNALAVVLAAIRLANRDDVESFSTAIEGRVAAMARTHELLAVGRWLGTDLYELARAELAPFLMQQGGVPRANVEGPSLLVEAQAAQAFSMVLHELATNAAKYGALSVASGTVRLEWSIDDQAGLLRLRWAEQGGPSLGGEPAERSFGSQVIEAIIVEQLGGKLHEFWRTEGLELRIEVPLAGVLTSADPKPAHSG